jgi:hypothetical protein
MFWMKFLFTEIFPEESRRTPGYLSRIRNNFVFGLFDWAMTHGAAILYITHDDE